MINKQCFTNHSFFVWHFSLYYP